jgi:hypothetical protein
MSVRRIVRDITTSRLHESRAFYADLLGETERMDLEWIVTLVAPGNPAVEISLLGRAQTAPVQAQLSIEVDDGDSVYADAKQRSMPIVYPLTDESWEVRRFFMVDPNCLAVNVLSHHKKE